MRNNGRDKGARGCRPSRSRGAVPRTCHAALTDRPQGSLLACSPPQLRAGTRELCGAGVKELGGGCMHAEDLKRELGRWFGFAEFLPGQLEVMEHLLAGRSAAAVFPTGGGKSLCYQLPALMLEGVTLVVSPLIALMKDQVDALTARGIPACRLDSSLTAEQHAAIMEQLRRRDLRLLYVAPERFNNERFRQAILGVPIALFAVDEAHCISEWGHNFRPDYLKLAEFARSCQAARILALTATATPRVTEDICRELQIPRECAVCTGFYRANLTLRTTVVPGAERDRWLVERLRERPSGATIVYVTLQKTAEQVAERLRSAGFDARAYHAALDDEVRSETQDWFLRSDAGIVVATIAFGMGVDKPDIRYVYHYNLPKSLENYSQEIGRAGRDGASSVCEMLVCLDDLNTLENFAYGDTPTRAAIHMLLQEVFSKGEQFDVSYHELSSACDIRLLVVRTLLTYLELRGYLEGGTPFYSTYQFKPRMSSRQILEQFSNERREFLQRLLGQARKARTWFSIDLDRAAATLRTPRDRIVRALDYLGERQMLELNVKGVRNRYRRLKPCADFDGLAEELYASTQRREQREIARLHQVLELVGHDGCQVASLCHYFGETREAPCGHCSWCLDGRQPLVVPARPEAPLDPEIRQRRRR